MSWHTNYSHIMIIHLFIYMFTYFAYHTWSHVLFDIVLIVLKNMFCLIRSLFMSIIYLLVYFTWNKMITKSFTFLIHDISYSYVKKISYERFLYMSYSITMIGPTSHAYVISFDYMHKRRLRSRPKYICLIT